MTNVLSDEKIQHIRELTREGRSIREIARMVGVNRMTANVYQRKFRHETPKCKQGILLGDCSACMSMKRRYIGGGGKIVTVPSMKVPTDVAPWPVSVDAERLVWDVRCGEGVRPLCPRCGSECYARTTRKLFLCKNIECRYNLSATTGTLFQALKVPLARHLAIVRYFASYKKGVRSCDVAKEFFHREFCKTAYVLVPRLRAVCEMQPDGKKEMVPEQPDFSSDECERRFAEVLRRCCKQPAQFDLATGQPFEGEQISPEELKLRGYD